MTLEYTTLGLYFIILIVLGIVFSKFTKNLSDFVRGGGQGTWWLVGCSVLMSGISAFTFTGNASAAFEAGPTFLIIYVANTCSFLICAWFLAAWFRQTRAHTVADILRERFSPVVEQFTAYIGVVLGPLSAAIQLWALAEFARTVFGFNLEYTIIGIGLIVTIYSTTGGRWAVMATDFVQGVVMIVITTFIAILAYHHVGGFANFFGYFSDPRFAEDFQLVKESGEFSGDRFTWHWIIIIFFTQLYAQISLSSAHRYLAVKDGKEARKAALLAAVLMAAGALIWFFPVMVARFMHEEAVLAQASANGSYAWIAQELLPNGLMGILLAAMFSATMSSMDTGLNSQVGTIARNIIPALRRRLGLNDQLSDKTNLFICKLLTAIIGGLIITYSLFLANFERLILFDAFLLVGSIVGVPMGLPIFMGLVFRKLPTWGYWMIFGSTIIPVAATLLDSHWNEVQWTIQHRNTLTFSAAIISTVLALVFARYHESPASRERVNNFFKRMKTPIDFKNEVGEATDASQMQLIGSAVSAVGVLLFSMLIVDNTTLGRLGVAAVAGSVLVLGLLMLWGAKVERRRVVQLAADEPDGPPEAEADDS